MNNVFTIGTNGKSVKEFIDILKQNNIDLVIDIRLNNKSQLAGFAKGGEEYLGYILKLVNINYIYDPYFAPSKEILDNYHKNQNWFEYVEKFSILIKDRNMKNYYLNHYLQYKNVCLLCVEETDKKCHRRLVAESIVDNIEDIKHL